jgi:hypothetical protein
LHQLDKKGREQTEKVTLFPKRLTAGDSKLKQLFLKSFKDKLLQEEPVFIQIFTTFLLPSNLICCCVGLGWG